MSEANVNSRRDTEGTHRPQQQTASRTNLAPDDCILRLERTFEAPVDVVYAAWVEVLE